MGIGLSRSTDDTRSSNVKNLEASKMSKLGQQDHASINEAVAYEMKVELECLSVQHIETLQQENGTDFRCDLDVGLSNGLALPGQNSDFSEIDYDPVRPIPLPRPPPMRFYRRRNNAQQYEESQDMEHQATDLHSSAWILSRHILIPQ